MRIRERPGRMGGGGGGPAAPVVMVIVVLLVLLVVAGLYLALAGRPSESGGSPTTNGTPAVASSMASAGSFSAGGANSTSGDWVTYHLDNARTGFAASSTKITGARPDWRSPVLDGEVYAEPLVVGDRVLVATENDSVYSLSASNGSIVWRAHLGDPIAGSSLPCGDIDPSGITGTPVIDPGSRTIFVVAFLSPAHHVLFALNIDTGATRFQEAADAPGADPNVEQQRAALTLANGMVYVPYGGLNGDCGQYHGWVVGFKASGAQAAAYEVPTQREGAIWAPSGAAADPSGNIYVATGNGASGTSFDHGDSVIKLSSSLQEISYFAPTNWAQLNEADLDVGSVGPAIVGPNTLFQAGKEGVGYLVSMGSPGGIGGQVYEGRVCASSGVYGGTAFAGSLLYVPCQSGLVAVEVSNSSFSIAWKSGAFDSGPPIVTGDLVWAVDTSNSVLHAFNASSGEEAFTSQLAGGVPHFCTPSSGDGRVFVASGDHIASFLLLPSS